MGTAVDLKLSEILNVPLYDFGPLCHNRLKDSSITTRIQHK